MSLRDQEPKLRIPRPRDALIKVHSDLLTVHQHISEYAAHHPAALTNLEKLVLALEDRRFLKHCGVDLRSSVRETLRAVLGRKHGGASTIDMQFVRTATEYKQKTLKRKLYEIFLAVLIQFRYSKIVILRSYLSCAFFGSRLKGADSVALKLFDCLAEDLTLDQAAEVAAMLVYPRPLSPTEEWESKIKRRAGYGKRVYVANKERFDQLPR